jgi:hypothetical protein
MRPPMADAFVSLFPNDSFLTIRNYLGRNLLVSTQFLRLKIATNHYMVY